MIVRGPWVDSFALSSIVKNHQFFLLWRVDFEFFGFRADLCARNMATRRKEPPPMSSRDNPVYHADFRQQNLSEVTIRKSLCQTVAFDDRWR